MQARPIEVLADHVIDQIAAGEVVERPASVVKELCENALDAGARDIAIEVDGGGRSLIRIVDDGHGMTAGEARKAILRHATSKLRCLEDLVGIGTMGFRGEALSSIAAVSRLTLVTRPRGEAAAGGVRIEIEGGRVVAEREVGAPPGTTIEVRDLLYNVPARLKFMKGEATEAGHIGEVIERLAMAHPSVAMRLRQRGRTALEAPAARDAHQRVAALLGPRLADRLCRVRDGEGRVRVEAFLAAPSCSQSTARGLTLFVGRRAVRDRGLAHAVLQGYGELIPRGRYPTAVVFVEVDGPGVDVNVHPQKLEVRFADPPAVYAAVRHAIRRAVADAPWLADDAGDAAPAARQSIYPAADARPASTMATDYARERARAAFGWAGGQTSLGGVGFKRVAPWPAQVRDAGSVPERPTASPSTSPSPSSKNVDVDVDLNVRVSVNGDVADPDKPAGFFASLRYLGQLDRTYLIAENTARAELVLVDQHAAHERVAFERLRARFAGEGIARQRLLFPHTLEASALEAAVADQHLDALARLGYEVEPFGARNTLAVRSVPSGLRASDDPFDLLRRLLADLGDGGGAGALEARLDLSLATIACHSVVRAGDAMSSAEVESLFAALDGVDDRVTCPHGRPVLIRVPVDELARRFGR